MITKSLSLLSSLSLGVVLVACGPSGRAGVDGAGSDDPNQCVGVADGTGCTLGGIAGTCSNGACSTDIIQCTPQSEAVSCNDGRDNDCDLRVDCGDSDCSGVGDCPICGVVENPEATPLPLPDGIGESTICSTDAQCTDATIPNCVAKECHASYSSTLDFIGFPAGSTLDDTSKLLSVCVTMEHSWLRDLQMELIAPSGQVIALHKFIDRSGGEIFLGAANDDDDAANPVPGVGAKYCWTGAAANIMVAAPTVLVGGSQTLPAGDYAPVTPYTALMGATLNGLWEMRVTDLWPIDNGFLFEWSISFDPSLVEDCSGPIIQ